MIALKLMVRCLKTMNVQNSNILKKKKIKSTFMIYADFEITLMPGDNEKENPEESYTNKY